VEKILLLRNKTRYRRLYNRLAGFIHPFSTKKLLPCPHFNGNSDFPFFTQLPVRWNGSPQKNRNSLQIMKDGIAYFETTGFKMIKSTLFPFEPVGKQSLRTIIMKEEIYA